jgi:hypothetical protein
VSRTVDVERWRQYFTARDDGYSIAKAARIARIGPNTAYNFENGGKSSGRAAALAIGRTQVAGRTVVQHSTDAQRALDDFAYFRTRYFGRKATPWQEKAAYSVLGALDEPDKSYLVINAPPGLGKSTLFTHDVVAWLIARRRSIRILIGSRTGRQARMYVSRLRRTLERLEPPLADAESARISGASDAIAVMAYDFGTFKPEGRAGKWTDSEFTVVQANGMSSDDKENTVAAYGMDEGFLGGRYDLCIWDDLVDRKNTRNTNVLEELIHWWQTEGETRVEPGGAVVLQGQRMAPHDLYRWALDVETVDDTPKYRHIKYTAHDDANCTNDHSRAAKFWPEGCLLDPVRLPYRACENIRRQDSRLWEIQYQQSDGTESSGLVHRVWLDGGDSDGQTHPGCYDRDRAANEIPDDHYWSMVTVDPSPSNWWAVQWWAINPTRPSMALVKSVRAKMSNLQFLSMDLDTREYSGVLHDIWSESVSKGVPVTQVIVEANAAQKWLIGQQYVQKWQRSTGVTIYPHTTNINKLDPNYGVQGVAQFFKQGAIRLPDADPRGRVMSKLLTDEALAWPKGRTDDQVMALWFMVRTVLLQYAPQQKAPPAFSRPSWLGHRGRGLPHNIKAVG